MVDPLEHLNPLEHEAVLAYLRLLETRLEQQLERVLLFGSFARGDVWPDFMQIRSDIDLLVVTHGALEDAEKQAFEDATYQAYLSSGRQISPQFWTLERYQNPDEAARPFLAQVLEQGRVLV